MNEYIYIVAGDEMGKLMKKEYPDFSVIPFREDLSRGSYNGYDLNKEFIKERAVFWNVTTDEYKTKFSLIINLDFSKKYVLCFGEDDCCKANLDFLINYLQFNKYQHPIKIKIVNEENLQIIKEYDLV